MIPVRMEMGAGNSPLPFFSFPQALAASEMSLDEGRELQHIEWISSVPNARNAVSVQTLLPNLPVKQKAVAADAPVFGEFDKVRGRKIDIVWELVFDNYDLAVPVLIEYGG